MLPPLSHAITTAQLNSIYITNRGNNNNTTKCVGLKIELLRCGESAHRSVAVCSKWQWHVCLYKCKIMNQQGMGWQSAVQMSIWVVRANGKRKQSKRKQFDWNLPLEPLALTKSINGQVRWGQDSQYCTQSAGEEWHVTTSQSDHSTTGTRNPTIIVSEIDKKERGWVTRVLWPPFVHALLSLVEQWWWYAKSILKKAFNLIRVPHSIITFNKLLIKIKYPNLLWLIIGAHLYIGMPGSQPVIQPALAESEPLPSKPPPPLPPPRPFCTPGQSNNKTGARKNWSPSLRTWLACWMTSMQSSLSDYNWFFWRGIHNWDPNGQWPLQWLGQVLIESWTLFLVLLLNWLFSCVCHENSCFKVLISRIWKTREMGTLVGLPPLNGVIAQQLLLTNLWPNNWLHCINTTKNVEKTVRPSGTLDKLWYPHHYHHRLRRRQ